MKNSPYPIEVPRPLTPRQQRTEEAWLKRREYAVNNLLPFRNAPADPQP